MDAYHFECGNAYEYAHDDIDFDDAVVDDGDDDKDVLMTMTMASMTMATILITMVTMVMARLV